MRSRFKKIPNNVVTKKRQSVMKRIRAGHISSALPRRLWIHLTERYGAK